MRREFDVIVYGATGFTGQLVAEHLARHARAANPRWALAGRSVDKLRALRDTIRVADATLLIVDSDNPQALHALVRRTSVVINVAGPYQLYGGPVVMACVDAGTSYIDLAGEPIWMREIILKHDAAAKASGARIVFGGGYESVPFDLAVQMVQDRAIAETGKPAPRIRARILKMLGSPSGGSLASLRATIDMIEADPTNVDVLNDPFAFTPGRRGAHQPAADTVQFEEDAGGWVAPYVLHAMDSKIIHRTNALLDYRYGSDFRYDEMMVAGADDEGREAAEVMARQAAGIYKAVKAIPLLPGEGPSKAVRDASSWKLLFIGEAVDGLKIEVAVTGDADFGYGSTSKIVAETGLCLALDVKGDGGVRTPASLMGRELRDRLVARAGLTFDYR